MIKQGFSFGKVTMVLLGTTELWEVQTRPAGDGSLRTADRSRWVRDQQVGHRCVSPTVHIFIALEDQLLGTAQVGIGQGAPREEKEALVTVSGRKRKALALLCSLGRAGFLFLSWLLGQLPHPGPGQLHGCHINSSEARWTLEEGLDVPLSRANRFMESAWMTSFPLGGAGVRGGREGPPLVVQWLRF